MTRHHCALASKGNCRPGYVTTKHTHFCRQHQAFCVEHGHLVHLKMEGCYLCKAAAGKGRVKRGKGVVGIPDVKGEEIGNRETALLKLTGDKEAGVGMSGQNGVKVKNGGEKLVKSEKKHLQNEKLPKRGDGSLFKNGKGKTRKGRKVVRKGNKTT